MANLWQTLLPVASVFYVSLQSDIVFACDVAEHLWALLSLLGNGKKSLNPILHSVDELHHHLTASKLDQV